MKFRALALILMVTLAACKTAPRKAEEESVQTTNTTVDETTLGDSDSGKAMGLKTVHFAYDSFSLTPEAKTDLKNNGAILKDKGDLKIQIEGHCDQRGGIQYNIALGEKRANAVKQSLVEMGISQDRISTISYGNERLIDSGNTEDAHAKNRRANFSVTAK
jgi:peptidoglycan-associated lipoprotein